MSKSRNKFLTSLSKKELAILFLNGVFCIWLINPFQTTPKADSPLKPQSLDTVIPNGFQLVPIDIANRESLQSMVDSNALVDLYAHSGSGGPGRLLLRNVRLIQAPLNPNQFAVLLQEKNTKSLLSFPGPYFATIRPFRSMSEKVSESKPKMKIKTRQPQITYGDEG